MTIYIMNIHGDVVRPFSSSVFPGPIQMTQFYEVLPALGHRPVQCIFDFVPHTKYPFVPELELFFRETVGSSEAMATLGSYGCSRCQTRALSCKCGRFKKALLRHYDHPRPSDLKSWRQRCSIGDCRFAFVFHEHVASLHKRARLAPTDWA